MDNIKVLYDEETIEKRIGKIAEELYKKYGEEEVSFVVSLKGGAVFAMRLATKYKGNARFEFVRVSSYIGENSTGNLDLKIPLDEKNIKDRNVILVEDIIDTGHTLKFLSKYIKDMGPKSYADVVLLDKPSRREVDYKTSYVGFEIDNLFVVGYGLDYDEKYRNLSYVGYIEK